MDKDGKDWVRVTASFRNPYDCSVAPDGDIFTYDSDMEWDMGAPWYRPTRIYLCTPGGELGWRSGASNNTFPTLDMQPALVDIGPGSPTGTAMGTGASMILFFVGAFGLMFLGLDTLQQAMKQIAGLFNLASLPTGGYGARIAVMLIGLAMTAVMQSSTAAIATTARCDRRIGLQGGL